MPLVALSWRSSLTMDTDQARNGFLATLLLIGGILSITGIAALFVGLEEGNLERVAGVVLGLLFGWAMILAAWRVN